MFKMDFYHTTLMFHSSLLESPWLHLALEENGAAVMQRGDNLGQSVRPDTDEVTRSLRPLSSHFFQDTPVPGHYHIQDFTEEAELNPVKKTYGFKSPGRSVPVWGTRKGDLLLPGAYDYPDSTREVLKRQASYSFKTCPRPDIVTLGVRDKVGVV